MTAIRKHRNHALRMAREAAGREVFDRNIRKEREIGVNPKFLHSYRRQWAPSEAEWLKLSREWDERERSRASS